MTGVNTWEIRAPARILLAAATVLADNSLRPIYGGVLSRSKGGCLLAGSVLSR